GIGNSFKSKDKSKEIPNKNNIYMNFQNYNINFLLIHLRDTLHRNTSGALGIAEVLPNLAQVFKFKYPITYWYPTWREILSIHYLLENLTKDENY
ncbi:4798_t:CDS:2, partial [Gigaspora rosea]